MQYDVDFQKCMFYMLFTADYIRMVIQQAVKIATFNDIIYMYISYHLNNLVKKLFNFRRIWGINIYYCKLLATEIDFYHKNPLRFMLHFYVTIVCFFKQKNICCDLFTREVHNKKCQRSLVKRMGRRIIVS